MIPVVKFISFIIILIGMIIDPLDKIKNILRFFSIGFLIIIIWHYKEVLEFLK